MGAVGKCFMKAKAYGVGTEKFFRDSNQNSNNSHWWWDTNCSYSSEDKNRLRRKSIQLKRLKKKKALYIQEWYKTHHINI